MTRHPEDGMLYKGQTALITGPTSGIGAHLARFLAADGADLILVSQCAKRLEETRLSLEKDYPVKITTIEADLAQPDGAAGLINAVREKNLPVDLLINNAGYGLYGRFIEEPIKPQIGMITLHVTTPTQLTHAFLPGMLERGRGGVMITASTAGFQPLANQNVYSSTKTYLIHFAEALHEECLGHGVRITCFCPGPTETAFFDNPLMKTRQPGALARMSAEQVARIGYKAFSEGKLLEVPGWFNKFMVLSSKFSPRFITRKVAAKIIERVLPLKK